MVSKGTNESPLSSFVDFCHVTDWGHISPHNVHTERTEQTLSRIIWVPVLGLRLEEMASIYGG